MGWLGTAVGRGGAVIGTVASLSDTSTGVSSAGALSHNTAPATNIAMIAAAGAEVNNRGRHTDSDSASMC